MAESRTSDKIDLNDDERKTLHKLQRRKTLSMIFASAAAACAATALAVTIADPLLVFNGLRQLAQSSNDAVFQPLASVNWLEATLALVVPSMFAGMVLGTTEAGTMRTAASHVYDLQRSQERRRADLQRGLTREAQSEFVAGLREKTAAGQAISEQDYRILALCPDDIRAQAPEQASLAQTLKAAAAYGEEADIDMFLDAQDHSAAANTTAPKDYSNSLLALPALLTHGVPFLMLTNAVKMPRYQPEDFQLDMPQKPDLQKVSAAMLAAAPKPV